MSHRVVKGVVRSCPVSIEINGKSVEAYEGESIATVLIDSGSIAMLRDAAGRPRGPFCNMGVCFDCLVLLEDLSLPGTGPKRVKSCLTRVRAGLRVTTPDFQNLQS